jgi:ribosomal protein S18 acetylase RimI-like enzyme
MDYHCQPACHYALADLAVVFTRAFAGYVGGSVHMHADSLARFCAADGCDLSLSQLVLRGDQAHGFALIARRGWTSRVAAFGIVPDAQGQGVGTWLMGELIAQAQARGDHALTLEVIEQNERGLRLYDGIGMRRVRRLVGFRGDLLPGAPAALEQIDPYEVARRVGAWQAVDVPWPCSGETLMAQAAPSVGYHLDSMAYALITNPAADTLTIRGLAVAPSHQRQGWATRMVAALLAAHPGKRWVVPAILPEEYGEVFVRCGFTRVDISQFQMWMAVG